MVTKVLVVDDQEDFLDAVAFEFEMLRSVMILNFKTTNTYKFWRVAARVRIGLSKKIESDKTVM